VVTYITHVELVFLKLEELFLKVFGEGWGLIIEYGIWHTMKFENIINKKLGHINKFEWMNQGIKMCIFGKPIDHHHDIIFTMILWKAFNEIH